jgi:hypothetical protein
MKQPTEYWLRGPVPGIPPLLQPVAHALLQAGSEVATLMQDFDDALLWKKPAGVASQGFTCSICAACSTACLPMQMVLR